MSIAIGIDAGLVSIKAAIVGEVDDEMIFREISDHRIFFNPESLRDRNIFRNPPRPFLVTNYRRIRGKPVEAAFELLDTLLGIIPREMLEGVRICGSAGRMLAELLGVNQENDFKAIARGIGFIYPETRTVFEMGGENSRFLYLEQDPLDGEMGILDYEKSGDCAAGTGSFLDQQASRLKFSVEEIGRVVTRTAKSPKIAGRCSVFAKSDMIHAQQRGYQPEEVLKGLCIAVARNFKSSVVKGRKIMSPVAFIGGVAMNEGVQKAMEEVFGLEEGSIFVPRYHSWISAIGAALYEKEADSKRTLKDTESILRKNDRGRDDFSTHARLDLDKVTLLRERIIPCRFETDGITDAWLGIDVGSVSTNLALLDRERNVIKEIYLRTEGRPIEVVNRGLSEIERQFGDRVEIRGIGTTGSGRELIGELVGADTIKDEITAHKTGAEFIGETMLGKKVDTIFEIGGQDSKFIRIENGVVVDFAMNEACAAGTGSFLEERAEELEISIVNQFARMALESPHPIRLGERCTVFMEQDVNSYLQKGATREEIVAGLSYSVVLNYLNRVVRGRDIGEVIFFQGGTAYNNAIAAAFSKVLDKEIIVPPYNGVIGAIGAAILAQEKMEALGKKSGFRGYSLDEIDYHLKEFTCSGCSNFCNIQQFDIEGEKTYWGDQCSDKYRKRQKVEKRPVIDDLIALREEILLDGYDPEAGGKLKIGIPRCLYTFDRFPLWNRFFADLGFRVLLSGETKKNIIDHGIDATVSEPCFPITIAHGHVHDLLDRNTDYVFLPNILNSETPFRETESWVCVWGQTLPYVIMNSPAFEHFKDKFLVPKIEFRKGFDDVLAALFRLLGKFGYSRREIENALRGGYRAQSRFDAKLRELGGNALRILAQTGEKGLILLGRPYNLHDRGVNLDIPRKIREYYGANVIPMDFLPTDEVDIVDITDNMFWNYGRRILAAAKIAGRIPNMHLILITNFKCGPDSYIKHYIADACGKQALSLQFDGHHNDAGFMTRCEAYLDSNGFLRWWREDKKKSCITEQDDGREREKKWKTAQKIGV